MDHPVISVVGGSGVGLSFSVPRSAAPGETLLASALRYVNGGKAANQAIGVTRLGARARLVSALGVDPMAELARRIWATHGVADDDCEYLAEAATMVGALLIDPAGENSIIVAPGVLDLVDAALVRRHAAAIEESRLCLVSLEIPIGGAVEALRIARAAGVTTVLNPAPATDAAAIRELLRYCDVITPNAVEAAAITGVDAAADQATLLREWGAGSVAMTLGARGALVTDRAGVSTIVAADPVPVVDTSGAGDAFNAALAVALARNMPLAAAARVGCRAAGLIVQAPAFVEALHMWDGFVVG